MVTSAALLCLVVGVLDGDTLTVRCSQPRQFQERRIRISAIDAPEKAQPFGARAKQALSDLCFRQQATLQPVNEDGYGREVADVTCRGKDAASEQVRAGFAWVYRQYSTGHGRLYAVEREARAARVGLWSDPKPQPPWDWRRSEEVAAQAAEASGVECHTGPRGGRYTLNTTGRKNYGC